MLNRNLRLLFYLHRNGTKVNEKACERFNAQKKYQNTLQSNQLFLTDQIYLPN